MTLRPHANKEACQAIPWPDDCVEPAVIEVGDERYCATHAMLFANRILQIVESASIRDMMVGDNETGDWMDDNE